MTVDPELILVSGRWLALTAGMLLWGDALFHWRLMPDTRPAAAAPACVGALILGLLAMLCAQIALIGDGWHGLGDTGLVATVLLDTGTGRNWLCQAGAALVLCAVARHGGPRARAGAAGLLLAAQALGGHAAAGTGWDGAVRQVNAVVHLWAAGAWLGALPAVIRLIRRPPDPRSGTALIRYSVAGHLWVALTLATGLIATVAITGGLPLPQSSRYALLLWIKIAAVAAMIALALRNRYWLVPRLDHDPSARDAILRATATGLLLGCGASGLVAWLGTLDPG